MRKAAAPPHFRHIGFDSRLLKQMRIIRARYILKVRRNEFAALFYADFL